jgi:hypothetical protein
MQQIAVREDVLRRGKRPISTARQESTGRADEDRQNRKLRPELQRQCHPVSNRDQTDAHTAIF